MSKTRLLDTIGALLLIAAFGLAWQADRIHDHEILWLGRLSIPSALMLGAALTGTFVFYRKFKEAHLINKIGYVIIFAMTAALFIVPAANLFDAPLSPELKRITQSPPPGAASYRAFMEKSYNRSSYPEDYVPYKCLSGKKRLRDLESDEQNCAGAAQRIAAHIEENRVHLDKYRALYLKDAPPSLDERLTGEHRYTMLAAADIALRFTQGEKQQALTDWLALIKNFNAILAQSETAHLEQMVTLISHGHLTGAFIVMAEEDPAILEIYKEPLLAALAPLPVHHFSPDYLLYADDYAMRSLFPSYCLIFCLPNKLRNNLAAAYEIAKADLESGRLLIAETDFTQDRRFYPDLGKFEIKLVNMWGELNKAVYSTNSNLLDTQNMINWQIRANAKRAVLSLYVMHRNDAAYPGNMGAILQTTDLPFARNPYDGTPLQWDAHARASYGMNDKDRAMREEQIHNDGENIPEYERASFSVRF